jgi:hypothetical protein
LGGVQVQLEKTWDCWSHQLKSVKSIVQALIQGNANHGCSTMSMVWSLDPLKWSRLDHGCEWRTKFQSVQIVVEC